MVQGTQQFGQPSLHVDMEMGPGGVAVFNPKSKSLFSEASQNLPEGGANAPPEQVESVANNMPLTKAIRQAATGEPVSDNTAPPQQTTVVATSGFRTRRAREQETLSKAALHDALSGYAPAYRPMLLGRNILEQPEPEQYEPEDGAPPTSFVEEDGISYPPHDRAADTAANDAHAIKIETAGS